MTAEENDSDPLELTKLFDNIDDLASRVCTLCRTTCDNDFGGGPYSLIIIAGALGQVFGLMASTAPDRGAAKKLKKMLDLAIKRGAAEGREMQELQRRNAH